MKGKKKAGKRFRAVKAVKELARERIGPVPASRVVPDRKKKEPTRRHKPSLSDLLQEE